MEHWHIVPLKDQMTHKRSQKTQGIFCQYYYYLLIIGQRLFHIDKIKNLPPFQQLLFMGGIESIDHIDQSPSTKRSSL